MKTTTMNTKERKTTMNIKTSLAVALTCALAVGSLALPTFAQEQITTDLGTLDKATAEQAFPAKPPYSPYAGRNFPTRPFFGDTHTHTSFSFDAGAFGCRLGPKDAYRFAKGEEITASSGQQVKLSRPLDFLVVSDHSDQMGFFPTMLAGDPKVLANPQGRKWYDMIQAGQGRGRSAGDHPGLLAGDIPQGTSISPRLADLSFGLARHHRCRG